MEPKSALGNVMSQMQQVPQPGDRTDPLLTAMKALQTFSKATMERDPKSPEVKLVRQIIMELARLTHMDQSNKAQEGNPMEAPIGSDMGIQPELMGGMQGAPEIPSLDGMGLKI